jgi:fucose permease
VTRSRLILIIAFVAFVALGMPKAAFGVAWPSVATDLAAPIAQLGLFIALHVGGYFLGSVVSGRLSHRIGNGPMLAMAAAALTLGLIGYAIAPSQLALGLSAIVLGVGGGLLDAGINAHVALHYGARAMGFLHASFGIGATLGPLIMTLTLQLDGSWRIGFILLVILQAGITIAIWRTSDDWDTSPEEPGQRPRLTSDQRTTAAMALLVFVLYGGVEVATGSWAFTLFTEGRGMSETTAGLAVTGFWAGLTVSRLILGAVGDRVAPNAVLRASASGALVGAVLMWWNPTAAIGAFGLVFAGFTLGPVFPLQMLLTAPRFGPAATPPMAGYQLAGATVGAAAIPGLIGVLVAANGLEMVGPVVVATTAGLLIITVLLARRSSTVGSGVV